MARLVLLSNYDLRFMIKELGIHGAISYAEKISRINGPLAAQYLDAWNRLQAYAVAKGHIET
jgi:hypothetical protein